MGFLTLETVVVFVGAAAGGGLVGWLLSARQCKARIQQFANDWQTRVDMITRQRDRFSNEIASLRTSIESQQSALHKHECALAKKETELQSAQETEKRMTKDIFTLRAERDDTKSKIGMFQRALVVMKQQSADLQNEFLKSREFYKGELVKAFEKRKAMEAKLEDARAEQDSFRNLLNSSRSEHESVNRMLESAQVRLAKFDELENQVIKLEAENAQLTHDRRLADQKIEVLRRDLDELDELKVQNRELSQCLKSMEDSRRQYEEDAKRYRQHANEQEKHSETLRLRLDEVEQNFQEIENQQRKALKDARKSAAPAGNGAATAEQERDDLQAIVGIGKVFEQTLHELGIYTFRQIANFDMSDIARVNRALGDCKGRMEQDDWIGQAKELYYKKHSEQVHS